MSSSEEWAGTKPESLGTNFIDPGLFEHLRELYDNSEELSHVSYQSAVVPQSELRPEFICWCDPSLGVSEEHPDRIKVLQALGSVTERLLEYAVRERDQAPKAIGYDIRTAIIEPSEAPVGGSWHIDGDSTGLGNVLVASTLPTEIIVDGADAAVSKEFHETHQGYWYYGKEGAQEIDRALKIGSLALYTPEPYEGVVIRGHVHRPAVNDTEQSLSRVWFRAMFFDSIG